MNNGPIIDHSKNVSGTGLPVRINDTALGGFFAQEIILNNPPNVPTPFLLINNDVNRSPEIDDPIILVGTDMPMIIPVVGKRIEILFDSIFHPATASITMDIIEIHNPVDYFLVPANYSPSYEITSEIFPIHFIFNMIDKYAILRLIYNTTGTGGIYDGTLKITVTQDT